MQHPQLPPAAVLSHRARPHPKEEGAHVLSVQHLTPPPTRAFHHHGKGLCIQHWDAAATGNVALWFLPAPHSSASPYFNLHTPCCSCHTSHGPTATPRAMSHTQRPCALEGKSHSPLNISVHQQPDQDPCHSHKDWVMVHTLQPYGSKRERKELLSGCAEGAGLRSGPTQLCTSLQDKPSLPSPGPSPSMFSTEGTHPADGG